MTFKRGAAFTGARAHFSLNGTPIGFATNCDGNEQIMRLPLRVLGSLYVVEHVPVGYDMAFNASVARLVGRSLKSLGLWPKHMPSAEEFLREVLAFSNLSATLEDPITGDVVYRAQRIVPASKGWSLDAQGMATVRTSFLGEKLLEESE